MEEILCEVEALKSIFEEEISVEDGVPGVIKITKKIRPTDSGDVSSASILASFCLKEGYPASPPAVSLTNPRGISEDAYSLLRDKVENRIAELEGMPVVYDVIQLCEDFLLENQHSDAQLCPICLCELAGAPVSSTPCDHYVHSECLNAHRDHSRQQLGDLLRRTPFDMRSEVDKSLLCPVCRMIIEEEIEPKDAVDPPKGKRKSVQAQGLEDFDFNWESWRSQLANLQLIMEKQRSQGGIIDLEEERKRNLITEDTVVILNVETTLPNQETSVDSSRPAGPQAETVPNKRRNFRRKTGGPRFQQSTSTREQQTVEQGRLQHVNISSRRAQHPTESHIENTRSHGRERGHNKPRRYHPKPQGQQQNISDTVTP